MIRIFHLTEKINMLKKLYNQFIWSYYVDRFLNWWTLKFQNPYNLNYPSGNCPVQMEGLLPTGEYYYFRARGSSWRVELFPKEEDFWCGRQKQLFTYSEKYGETFEAGGMSKREAIEFATLAVKKYYSEIKNKL